MNNDMDDVCLILRSFIKNSEIKFVNLYNCTKTALFHFLDLSKQRP